jgi:hypothetical protein
MVTSSGGSQWVVALREGHDSCFIPSGACHPTVAVFVVLPQPFSLPDTSVVAVLLQSSPIPPSECLPLAVRARAPARQATAAANMTASAAHALAGRTSARPAPLNARTVSLRSCRRGMPIDAASRIGCSEGLELRIFITPLCLPLAACVVHDLAGPTNTTGSPTKCDCGASCGCGEGCKCASCSSHK